MFIVADLVSLNYVVSTAMRRRMDVSMTLFRRPVPSRVTAFNQSQYNVVSTSMRHGVASTLARHNVLAGDDWEDYTYRFLPMR